MANQRKRPRTNRKQNNKKKPIRAFFAVAIVLTIVFLLGAVLASIVLAKKLQPNRWLTGQYEVKGVDVSHYQGDIDWQVLQTQDITFAYIKATEGSSSADEKFAENWVAAKQTKLYVGAYHFFSFDSAGATQAENYIKTVGDLSGCLVPAVDVEFYADKKTNPPQKEQIVGELHAYLDALEQEYHVKPLIYCTYSAYGEYIQDEFTEYPLWIRNVYYPPSFGETRDWTLWQYTDTAILEGYYGGEKYIDMNIYRGSKEELQLVVE